MYMSQWTNKLIALTMFVFVSQVKAEGYYCPYNDLGASGENVLLYDYYNGDSSQGYWERINQTGWQTVGEYCRLKGDVSVHSDAGEWKCNDSHLLCEWDSSTSNCRVNNNRLPDCRELCQAVLQNEGPQCLGNCPNGQFSNTLYSICPPRVSTYTRTTSQTQITTALSSTYQPTLTTTLTTSPTSTIIITKTITKNIPSITSTSIPPSSSSQAVRGGCASRRTKRYHRVV